MEFTAVSHEPKYRDSYALDAQTLEIRVKTKKGDVQHADLIFGDPYLWEDEQWVKHSKAMHYSGSSEWYDFWTVRIHPLYQRVRYGFTFRSGQQTWTFTEKGWYNEPPKDTDEYFCFPFMNAVEVFRAPKWVEETVWYQIFPERFHNGDSSLSPEGTPPWGSKPPTPSNFFGGDLKGVEEKLDHLIELGVNGIYFTPIFKALSNHKYDTIDYFEVDPHFGDTDSLKSLIDACHKRGIRVMFDAVFNHSGFYFPPFQDVLKHGSESKYKDWFHIKDFPVKTSPAANYDTFAFTPQMPKLNTEHPEVKEYLLDVATYWIKEFDIDGWRLDVANEVDHTFWREFRMRTKAIKPDLFILGEIWHDSMPWLQGDQFDSVMNYPFTEAALDFVAKGRISSHTFAQRIAHILHQYPSPVHRVAFNLLGSHDTPRVLTEAGHNVSKVKMLYLLLFAFPGTPCIYYGDEIGLTGEHDPGCRKCMVWEKDQQNRDLFAFLQQLITLRKQHSSFSPQADLSIEHADADTNLLVLKKTNNNKEIYLVMNPSFHSQSMNLSFFESTHKETLIEEGITFENESIYLKPYSFFVLH
ncbi:glycoside hydrolase family 13 protein [Alteribacillus bidgolensis]|uniref:Glycosidase n=1 Tax=Alteribacillus bidgolensis TaxID=930129 RepID=A0A1G8J2M3_9BACI|nr:glycoside hydrolase family 13 protein [Alteribacillus bidgolensis]SDI25313.1 Glycosidase [Alteribacillus bidgolensis]